MHGPPKEHELVHLLLEEDKEAAWRVSEAICCSAVSKSWSNWSPSQNEHVLNKLGGG